MPLDPYNYPRAVLAIRCPRCEVPSGAFCQMPGGNKLLTPHIDRRRAVVEMQLRDTSWITDETLSEDLPLSVRAANCLRHSNLRTVGQVRRTPDRTILRFPNMGRTSLRELRDLVGYAPGNAPEDQARVQRRPFAIYANESPERKIYGGSARRPRPRTGPERTSNPPVSASSAPPSWPSAGPVPVDRGSATCDKGRQRNGEAR